MSSYDVWDTSNPARGDMTVVRDFAAMMRARATMLKGIVLRSDSAAAETEAGGFVGIAGVDWRSVTNRTVSQMAYAMAAVVESRESAATRYADDVDLIRAETIYANDLQHESTRLRRIFEEMDPQTQETTPGRGTWETAEQKRHDSRALLTRLRARRSEADSAFAAVLNETPGVGNISAELLMQLGTALPGALTTTTVGVALTIPEAVEATFALRGHYSDPEALAAFEALLSGLGDDPAVWDVYYEAIGGEEAMNLVNQLAEANVYPLDETSFAVAAQIAGELRHGLSLASEGWSVARGEEFAQQMLDGSTRNIAIDIAFFFGDANGDKMGQSLTVAMATEIDRIERSEDGYDQRRFGLDNGYQEPMVRFAEALADPADGLNDLVFGDPSATVFQTLSKYPDATLEWLQDGPKGTGDASARMEYWFGERDSESSGYLGPVSLLEGVENATGGVLSGLDPAVWEQTAQIMHDGIHMLTVENPHPLGADPMEFGRSSSGASRDAMARVIGNYLAAFVERPLDQGSFSLDPTIEASLYGPGGTSMTIANVPRDELLLFMRGFANDAGAVQTLAHYSVAYEGVVVALVDGGQVSVEEGLNRIVVVRSLSDALMSGLSEEDQLAPWEAGHTATDGLVTIAAKMFKPPPGVKMIVSAGIDDVFGGVTDGIEAEYMAKLTVGETDLYRYLTDLADDRGWTIDVGGDDGSPPEAPLSSVIGRACDRYVSKDNYFDDYVYDESSGAVREGVEIADEDLGATE